eukprot:280348-Pyramimonas_sp.AAC.1
MCPRAHEGRRHAAFLCIVSAPAASQLIAQEKVAEERASRPCTVLRWARSHDQGRQAAPVGPAAAKPIHRESQAEVEQEHRTRWPVEADPAIVGQGVG